MDWAGLMRAGMGRLGLTPEVFWGLTPAELALMLGVGPQAAPMSRERLEGLLRQFPDLPTDEERQDGGQERV